MRFKPWPGIVFVLLGCNSLIVIATIAAAVWSKSPIDPDYDAGALRRDERADQTRRNAVLGWHVQPSLRAESQLMLRVLDGSNRPLRAPASVHAELFGPSGELLNRFEFVPTGEGEFVANLGSRPEHGSRLHVAVSAGLDAFTAEVCILDLEAAP